MKKVLTTMFVFVLSACSAGSQDSGTNTSNGGGASFFEVSAAVAGTAFVPKSGFVHRQAKNRIGVTDPKADVVNGTLHLEFPQSSFDFGFSLPTCEDVSGLEKATCL